MNRLFGPAPGIRAIVSFWPATLRSGSTAASLAPIRWRRSPPCGRSDMPTAAGRPLSLRPWLVPAAAFPFHFNHSTRLFARFHGTTPPPRVVPLSVRPQSTPRSHTVALALARWLGCHACGPGLSLTDIDPGWCVRRQRVDTGAVVYAAGRADTTPELSSVVRQFCPGTRCGAPTSMRRMDRCRLYTAFP